jgi:nucleotide-binding universal stress UspA family protein
MKTLVVAVDGSPGAEAAVRVAADIGKASDAELVLAHIIESDEVPEQFREFVQAEHIESTTRSGREVLADHILSSAMNQARDRGARQVRVVSVRGDPVKAILDIADGERADAIVVGHRGLGRLQGLLLGSVAQKLVTYAHRPVVVAR